MNLKLNGSKPFNNIREKSFETEEKSSKFLLEIMTRLSTENNIISDRL